MCVDMSVVRGLNVIGLPLFDNDVILFDRFGSSGGGMAALIDCVSFESPALAFRFIWDSDNDGAEPCILTLAKTENSWAHGIDAIVPVGDCSPSLLL